MIGWMIRQQPGCMPQIEFDDRNALGNQIERIRNGVVAIGLKKLFKEKHFSICDLETLIKAANVVPNHDLMRLLRPLHCVDWADIPRDLREDICEQIINMLGGSE